MLSYKLEEFKVYVIFFKIIVRDDMSVIMLGLHPNLIQLLESDPEKTHIDAVPVLQRDTEPKHLTTKEVRCSDYLVTDSKSLFTFRAQKIRLSKDHEHFEVG